MQTQLVIRRKFYTEAVLKGFCVELEKDELQTLICALVCYANEGGYSPNRRLIVRDLQEKFIQLRTEGKDYEKEATRGLHQPVKQAD